MVRAKNRAKNRNWRVLQKRLFQSFLFFRREPEKNRDPQKQNSSENPAKDYANDCTKMPLKKFS